MLLLKLVRLRGKKRKTLWDRLRGGEGDGGVRRVVSVFFFVVGFQGTVSFSARVYIHFLKCQLISFVAVQLFFLLPYTYCPHSTLQVCIVQLYNSLQCVVCQI